MGDGLMWERTDARVLASGVRWPKAARGDPRVAVVAIEGEALVDALGPPTLPHANLDGIGPMEVWTLGWPCGCEAALWRVHTLDAPPSEVDVLSNDADVEHVLHHLALPGIVRWRADSLADEQRPRRPEPLQLVRQDDNGHRFLMRRFDSRVAAECAQRTFEARGHKQLYLIEPG